MEIVKFFKIFIFLLSNFYISIWSFLKRQRSGTSSDNEWQRVTKSGTTSDNEW